MAVRKKFPAERASGASRGGFFVYGVSWVSFPVCGTHPKQMKERFCYEPFFFCANFGSKIYARRIVAHVCLAGGDKRGIISGVIHSKLGLFRFSACEYRFWGASHVV